MPQERITVTFRDAQLAYKNFAGEKKQYNAEGDRNFNIMLDEETAQDLLSQGWNVKIKERANEDGTLEVRRTLQVAVSYKVRPPQVWLISAGGRNMLGQGLVGVLDQLESSKVDLVINAYDWEMSGNRGRKAYLETMFFTAYQNELEAEYSSVPIIGSAGDGPLAIEGVVDTGARQPYDHEGIVVG